MKEKILEIQCYFIGKLVDGQFDVIRVTREATDFTVRVDNEYVFTYSVGFENANSTQQQLDYDRNFMPLPELTYAEKVQFISHFEEYRPKAVTE